MSELDMEINELSSKILQDKLSKMNERNDLRKAAENRRRKERFEFGSHAEQAEVFSETFKEHRKKIESEINAASEAALSGENRGKLTVRLDNTFKIIDALKRYLTESSMFLTAFDNEQAKIEFQEITNKFNASRDSLLPKKKFGFSAKSRGPVDSKPDPVGATPPPKTEHRFESREFGFFDQSNATLRLSHDDVDSRDLTLRNLAHCVVHLVGHPGSVYVHNVVDCSVVCGPTSRSIFIEDCADSRFYFACQQARIHNSRDCDFYMHVTSRAIIEDCHRVRVAPYLLHYANLADDFRLSSLDIAVNNWDRVDDFRHLSVDVASPNWTIIGDSERKALDID